MTKDEALRTALENLLQATRHLNACPATVEAAEKVLAQPEQMPVLQILATAIAKAATLAGITDCSKHSFTGPQLLMLLNDLKELAIKAPPKRQPLTKDQVDDLADDGIFLGSVYEITRAIEAAHEIKEIT